MFLRTICQTSTTFQISAPGGKDNVHWLHGVTHSREWLSTATLLKIMNRVRMNSRNPFMTLTQFARESYGKRLERIISKSHDIAQLNVVIFHLLVSFLKNEKHLNTYC